MLRGGEREEELSRARRRGRSWLILPVAGFTRHKSEPGSPTHSTFILHRLLNCFFCVCVCGWGRWRAPALEDTAAHPSPHCGIGSWVNQLRRRAPLRKRVMGYGRTAAASRMYTWGLVWIFTAKTNKTLWTTDFFWTFINQRELHTYLQGTLISFLLTHGLDRAEELGRMVSSGCFALVVVVLCCSSLTNGKKSSTLVQIRDFNALESLCAWKNKL